MRAEGGGGGGGGGGGRRRRRRKEEEEWWTVCQSLMYLRGEEEGMAGEEGGEGEEVRND